tara:strand:- start:38084 stop:38524 length:441 start_codon:yes stop_codon:yes gene_type:complete
MKRIELVEHLTKWGCTGCVYEDDEKGCWEAPDCGTHAVFQEVEKPTVIIMGHGSSAIVDELVRRRVIEQLEKSFIVVDAAEHPARHPILTLEENDITLYTGHYSQLPPISDLSMFVTKEPNYGKQKCWCGSRRKMSQCHPVGPKAG